MLLPLELALQTLELALELAGTSVTVPRVDAFEYTTSGAAARVPVANLL